MTLKEFRKQRGLTQSALAKKSGISRSVIIHIEQIGLRDLRTAVKLAKFYGVSLADLPLQ